MSDLFCNVCKHRVQPGGHSCFAEDDIVLGLEPAFSVLDNGGPGTWAEVGIDDRYEVADAEMQTVCTCEKREYALLICRLLNRATS